jgi:hypothetical protein
LPSLRDQAAVLNLIFGIQNALPKVK